MNMADPWQVLLHSLTQHTPLSKDEMKYQKAKEGHSQEVEDDILWNLDRKKVASSFDIADDIGKSEGTVRRYLTKLEEAGFVRVALKGPTGRRYWEIAQ